MIHDTEQRAVAARPLGRPSKLTPDRIERLCEALRAGHSHKTAVALAGISESAFYAWLVAADRPDAGQEFVDFLDAVRRAEVEGEDELVKIIQGAAKGGSWAAASWILERRHSGTWSKKSRLDINTPPTLNLSTIERHMATAGNDAELTQRCAEYARRGIPFECWDDEAQAHG